MPAVDDPIRSGTPVERDRIGAAVQHALERVVAVFEVVQAAIAEVGAAARFDVGERDGGHGLFLMRRWKRSILDARPRRLA